MSYMVNNLARPITLSHRVDGVVHKLTLNPGVNEISSSDGKLFAACEYVSTLTKAKKIIAANSLDNIDTDDMPRSKAKPKKRAGK